MTARGGARTGKRFFWAVIVAVSAVVVSGQGSVDERFAGAVEAWDRGDFAAALRDFRHIISSAGGDRFFDRIALITGELYQVVEVAPDGRAVRFDPTGRYATYDTGPRSAPATHIVDVEGGIRRVAELHGTGMVFSPAGGAVAYLRVRESPELGATREELERMQAQPEPDRQALAALQRKLSQMEAQAAEIVRRDLASGREETLPDGALFKTSLAFSADGREVYFVGAPDMASATDIYATSEAATKPRALTTGPLFKGSPVATAGGRFLVYATLASSPLAPAGMGRGGAVAAATEVIVLPLAGGQATTLAGYGPVVSADGSVLAYLTRSGGDTTLSIVRLGDEHKPTVVRRSADPLANPALAPDGSRVAWQMLHTRNYEIFVAGTDGSNERRITREIQHDTLPRFLTRSTILAAKGEPRHLRSYLYDLETNSATKLFHNNTIRTIAPEYEWAPNRDGTKLLIVAERDGDTISPERGVYLLDLAKKVTRDALIGRIDQALAGEQALRADGARLFKPIEAEVRAAVQKVSLPRIYEYEAALFDFDSKHITQPGNRRAIDYLAATFESFGYRPELQWFEPQKARTANVLATLRGAVNPELVYVVSSHFDSNQRGPGADDNSSATAVLLETARVLAGTPLPCTVIFAAFTGEEAGLLGSREFVRQAREKRIRIVGALNNDMIGWMNDYRFDNTIRYSNVGIRDLQHAAAFLFSRMVTYDAKYYKATDAAAYFEAYGDIVGGLGSYPVLGNPYYHQPTDLLETVNHHLLVEAAKFNIASIMRLAHGPSRVAGLAVGRATAGAIEVSWTPSPEAGVSGYLVAYGGEPDRLGTPMFVKQTRTALPDVKLKPGDALHVAVKAVGPRGLESWDWARAAVRDPRR